MSYRTSSRSGYGYESIAEIPEVPGFVARAYRTYRRLDRYGNAVPVPRVLWHWPTEFTEIPGTGMNVLQNLQKFRVRVIPR